jgi:hypothetical protein
MGMDAEAVDPGAEAESAHTTDRMSARDQRIELITRGERWRIAAANRNRGALPAHLPRYEVVIDIESKECPCSSGALHVIGDDRTQMLDLVPA